MINRLVIYLVFITQPSSVVERCVHPYLSYFCHQNAKINFKIYYPPSYEHHI